MLHRSELFRSPHSGLNPIVTESTREETRCYIGSELFRSRIQDWTNLEKPGDWVLDEFNKRVIAKSLTDPGWGPKSRLCGKA
jgi:hypothetical protein